MTRSPELKTRRLILKPFAEDEVSQLLSLFRDAHVRLYLLDDQLVDEDWARAEVESSQARFSESSAGLWSLRERSPFSGPIIGFAGFRPFFEPPQLQLLYGLSPQFWGRGYATEAAAAAIEYGFIRLGFDQIIAATDLPNQSSAAVMKRLGMKPLKTTDDGDTGTLFCRLHKCEWERQKN